MEPLHIRELKQVTTLSLEQTEPDAARLLRLLADYVEHSNGTLLSVVFANDYEDEVYHERLIAFVECPYHK
jgi:hypothetical protein